MMHLLGALQLFRPLSGQPRLVVQRGNVCKLLFGLLPAALCHFWKLGMGAIDSAAPTSCD